MCLGGRWPAAPATTTWDDPKGSRHGRQSAVGSVRAALADPIPWRVCQTAMTRLSSRGCVRGCALGQGEGSDPGPRGPGFFLFAVNRICARDARSIALSGLRPCAPTGACSPPSSTRLGHSRVSQSPQYFSDDDRTRRRLASRRTTIAFGRRDVPFANGATHSRAHASAYVLSSRRFG